MDENVSGCSTAQEIASVFLTKNSHGNGTVAGKQHCQSERIRREESETLIFIIPRTLENIKKGNKVSAFPRVF